MHRFANKWLFMLLALLLGVVPFTHVMAEITLETGSNTAVHTVAASHAGHVEHANLNNNACYSCTIAHSCDSGSCTCYQCGSCATTILHEPLTVHFASLFALVPVSDSTQPTHHPFLLFRPPRA